MQRYGNVSGESGVRAYEILPEAIRVQFIGGDTYDYTFASAGQIHVERMKRLARSGAGLATYISKYVKDQYAAKT